MNTEPTWPTPHASAVANGLTSPANVVASGPTSLANAAANSVNAPMSAAASWPTPHANAAANWLIVDGSKLVIGIDRAIDEAQLAG